MLRSGETSQVTKVSYLTVESKFIWKIENPAELSEVITSKVVPIPSVNAEWFLSIQAGQLDFYIKIINDERDQFFKQPNSKDDQYCFEVTFNGGPKSSNVFKDMSKNTHEKHKITNLEMNVPAKKFYTGNLSDGDYSEDDEHSRITAKNLQHPQIDINCKLWTIEAKVTIRTSRKLIRKVEICENEHTLCVDFEALSNNLPSDFTIIVKSKEFKVHKSVLSAQSVFMKMILFEMKESADNKVEIKDVEPSSFEKFLQFIYCEKVPEDLQHYAIDLFVLADKYKVEDLKIKCEKHLAENITKDNAMEVFKFANLHSSNYNFKRMSFQIIKEKLQETFDTEVLEKLLENEIFETMIN